MTLEVRKLDCLAGSWSADQINQAVKAYEAGRRHGVAVGTIQTQQNLRHALGISEDAALKVNL